MRIPEPPPHPARARITRPRAPRIAVIVTAAILLVLLMSLRGIASIITDYLWFDEVGRTDVWSRLFQARALPAAIATVVTFVITFVSLAVTERLAPTFRTEGPEDEITQRYRAFVAPYSGRIRFALSLLIAAAVGANAAGEWRSWLLFRNAVDFGQKDPQFGRDIGFYVFKLPFISFVLNLAFSALVLVFIVTLISHYLNGGIRVQNPFQRVTPQVKAHLSVLLAVMAVLKMAQYWFARYELVYSRRGTRQGAFYTDVKVQLPAYNLLVFIALVAAALFVVNILRRGWTLPIIAVGLWAFVSVIVGTVFPALTQSLSVKNSELAKETPYIERNIAATRAAFGLDQVKVVQLPVAGAVDRADIEADAAALETVRVWDPPELEEQFRQQQKQRPFYTFNDLDVDRYQIGDQVSPVIIGTRDLNPGALPSNSWLSRHLIYTHGSGAVVAAADEIDDTGASYLLSGIPPTGADELRIDEQYRGVYYGEGLDGFVVAASREREAEAQTPDGDETARVSYAGDGGVEVGGFFRKSALALRFWDRNLFLSSSVTANSRVLWVRDPRERVEKIAPFLSVDGDAYPVILDGRIKWIVDGYTTTNRYPYAQSLRLQDSTVDVRGLDREINYVRNSVKAVVDAYDGTVELYAWDEEDPLLRVWRKVFPGLVRDRSEISSELEVHFRYPEELFAAQTRQFAEYHVTDPEAFYNASQSWQVAGRATEPVKPKTEDSTGAATSSTDTTPGSASNNASPMFSLYQMVKLPGEPEPEFAVTRAFVPANTPSKLQAVVAGRSDPGKAGELVVYEIASEGQVASPALASETIQRDDTISPIITLLNNNGSKLRFGEMRILPVGDSLLYSQPFYISGESGSSFFVIRGIAVSDGGRAVLGDTFADAVDALVGSDEDPDNPDEPDPNPDATVEELLRRAAQAFDDADAAAADGDYEEQGRQLERARRLVTRALEIGIGQSADPADGAGGDSPGESSGAATTSTGSVTEATLAGA